MNFSKVKPRKCKKCGRDEGCHKSKTMHCPIGLRHRVVGYTSFHCTDTFTPKP
jgi:hypothetical protein